MPRVLSLPIFFYAQDVAFDTVDHANVPDQVMMELVVAGLSEESRKIFQDKNGSFKPVSQWTTKRKGAEHCVIACDEDDRVISFIHKVKSGTYNLRALPLQIRVFRTWYDIEKPKQNPRVTGTLDTSALPSALQIFDCSANAFGGEVDFQWLPPGLRDFMISRNYFTGSCNLKSLPKALMRCFLEKNAFRGSISLESLPLGLTHLRLHENNFQGTLNFDSLPDSLRHLNVGTNGFTGSFILSSRNAPIVVLARDTQMSGTAVVADNDHIRVDLACKNINAVHDENGDAHPSAAIILHDQSREMHYPRFLDLHEYEYRDVDPLERFANGAESLDDKLLLMLNPHAPSCGVTWDKNGRVTEISIMNMEDTVIFLDYIPPLVKKFGIPCFELGEGNLIRGTLNTSKLPRQLEYFNIMQENFTGTVDLTKLPYNLERIDLEYNQFYGKCDLTMLPAKLNECYLHVNNFSGSVDLSRLPQNLVELSINDNCLIGELDISSVRKELKKLWVNNNPCFRGRNKWYDPTEGAYYEGAEEGSTLILNAGFYDDDYYDDDSE